MKLAYFIAGNVWLFWAFLFLVGGATMRSAPARYAFFGLGGWFDPGTYYLLTVSAVVLSAVFFGLAAKTERAKG
jgi:hypothetical protein